MTRVITTILAILIACPLCASKLRGLTFEQNRRTLGGSSVMESQGMDNSDCGTGTGMEMAVEGGGGAGGSDCGVDTVRRQRMSDGTIVTFPTLAPTVPQRK